MSVNVQIKKKLDSFLLDISFQSDSQRIGILGASGCGKSMTLKSIAGIEIPDEGRIEVENRVLFDREQKINLKAQKRNVGYLFQNYALFPTMTVEKNIAAGLQGSRGENDKRVREMIEKFHLSGLEKRFPGQLSGGQQQRVALARIMAYEPDVILLDEPFSALDMYLKDQLQQELFQMLENYGGTVIMVSHNRDEVYRFSEELLIIEEGRSIVSGRTKELFQNPVKREAARLTGCKNFSRVHRVDAYTAEALDWGITIHTKRQIPEDTKWFGYRAHDFVPVWGERGENMLKVSVKSSAVLPFERNYYLWPEKMPEHASGDSESIGDSRLYGGYAENRQEVCWFAQREKLEQLEKRGLPDYLKLREEKLLFLE